MNTKPSPLFSILSLALLACVCIVPKLSADEPPVVHILATDPCAAEAGSDPAAFAVIRDGSTNTALTVLYRVGGTAGNGMDYETLSGSVTIPIGAHSATLNVTPIDDDMPEGGETVLIELVQPLVWPPPYMTCWPSFAFGHIADDDFEPTNRAPSVAIVSPPDGSVFESPLDLTILARASDSDGRVRTVEFFDGTNSLGIVTNLPIPIRPPPVPTPGLDPSFDVEPEVFVDLEADPGIDPVPIPKGLFRLVWNDVQPGRHVLTALATDNLGATTRSAPIEIKVHEPPPQPIVWVRATDPEAAEPNPTSDHLDTATFTIVRSGRTDLPLTVDYRLGGTASNGADYRELPFSLTIPIGERSADVVIEPLDDALVEGPESVLLKIVPPVCIATFPPPPDCYLVGRGGAARAVIRDHDSPPNLPPVVRIVRPLDGSVFLSSAMIPIVAQARDYDGRVVTVEFFEGTNSLGIVTNSPLSIANARPPFMVVWSNVPPGHYVLTAEATDNDGASSRSQPVEIKVVQRPEPPVVSIAAKDPIATEPGLPDVIDTATFTLKRDGSTDRPLIVFYRVSGTALNGVDYRELPGKVIFDAGASSADLVVVPLDDNLVEGTETVGITLEPAPCLSALPLPPDCYLVGTNNRARAIIRDNDVPPANQPPKVAIVRPEDGDVFGAYSDIAIYAAAADADGYVRTVEFFAGEHSLGVVTNSLSAIPIGSEILPDPEPVFRLVWRNVPPGEYALTAKATDNRGAMTVSGPVHIRVFEPPLPPVVTIYATDPFASEGDLLGEIDPTRPQPVDLPDPARFIVVRNGGANVDLVVYYSLGGTASNGVDYRALSGQVKIPRGSSRAEIVVHPIDDQLLEKTESVIATLLPVPCERIIPVPPECYVVGDPHGAVAYICDNDFNQSPRVAIVEPRDGDVFRAPADLKIEVATRDLDGWVGRMEIFEGTNRIFFEEILFIVAPPPGQLQSFSFLWTNVSAGSYVLTAKATDELGAMSVSEPARIRVLQVPPIPVVTIEATDRVASEPDPRADSLPNTATFKVGRRGDSSRPLKVFYRVGGTASNGVDYGLLSGEVVIPQNESAALIVIDPLDDRLSEGTESVIIELVQLDCPIADVASIVDGCYLVGQPRRDVAYIRDNDAPPNRPPTVALISPPDDSVFAAPADIRLVAAAEDHDGWVATVEFFEGTNSLGVVTNHPWVLSAGGLGKLRLDSTPEISPINPFTLGWSNVPPGHYTLTVVATDNLGASSRSAAVDITVVDPDVIPRVNLTATDPLAREGTTNTAVFRIRRAGPTNEALTVYYSICGTASNGVDYVTIPNSMTIPAGRRSARIVITPVDDHFVERLESVILRLLPSPVDPPTYVLGRPSAAGALILDNEQPLPSSVCLPDRSFHVRLPLNIGKGYRLEASTDLVNWETLCRNIATDDASGFVDEESPDYSRRFYRVMPEALVIDDE